MNRRNFLKSIIVAWTWLIVSKNVFAEKDVLEEVKTEVVDILSQENIKKLEKSINSIWKIEVDFFSKYFQIDSNWENYAQLFVDKVKQLQKDFKFDSKSQDWVLWSATLRRIYLEYYMKTPEKLNEEQKHRISIYEEMQWYSKKSWALYKKLDVYNHMTYFWKDAGINEEGTYINEKLFWKIPQEIDEKINKIIVLQYENKKILTFYINWKLHLATFVSPWVLQHKTPKLKTKWKLKPDLYHTSSEYPEAEKKKNWVKWWAIMPYAVHIDWAIWFHWSDWNIDWNPQSHGCIRTPLFYMKEIFEKVKGLWIENVLVDTTWIY